MLTHFAKHIRIRPLLKLCIYNRRQIYVALAPINCIDFLRCFVFHTWRRRRHAYLLCVVLQLRPQQI